MITYSESGESACLHRAGIVFGCLHSAFSVEVLAMEWGLEEFFKYVVAV